MTDSATDADVVNSHQVSFQGCLLCNHLFGNIYICLLCSQVTNKKCLNYNIFNLNLSLSSSQREPSFFILFQVIKADRVETSDTAKTLLSPTFIVLWRAQPQTCSHRLSTVFEVWSWGILLVYLHRPGCPLKKGLWPSWGWQGKISSGSASPLNASTRYTRQSIVSPLLS